MLDLATVIAAPSTAAMLADFGADCVKIEPPGGDSWRSGGAMFANDNRGKRSVCLDLTSAEGRGVLLQLVERADVVVTNMRPKALRKLGCDYESLRAANPKLIFAVLTAHGLRGPDVDKPGCEMLYCLDLTRLRDVSLTCKVNGR